MWEKLEIMLKVVLTLYISSGRSRLRAGEEETRGCDCFPEGCGGEAAADCSEERRLRTEAELRQHQTGSQETCLQRG